MRSFTDISMMFMITMPPTTIPMQTTPGIIRNSTLVSVFQNATSASALSTVKSFSSSGRSRCATRIASSARSMAPSISAASCIFTDTTVVLRRPYIDSNVLIGMSRNPSNDCPSTRPFWAMTPFTSSSRPATRTFRPTACAGQVEQLARHFPSKHHHGPSLGDVGIGEGFAGGESVVLDQLVGRGHPEDEHRAHGPVAVADVVDRRGPPRLQRNGLGVGNGAPHRLGVAGRDDRPSRDPLHHLVVQQPHRDRRAAHLEGIGADHRAGQVLLHVRVHALDDGHHHHEERDGHDDPEQREEGAQLGRPDGVEGNAEGFEEGHVGR